MNGDELSPSHAVQAELCRQLQAELARTLAATRLAGEPAGALELVQLAVAVHTCGRALEGAIAKRLATIAQESGDTRLPALHGATKGEREAAGATLAKRKENAPRAQTGGKNGGR